MMMRIKMMDEPSLMYISNKVTGLTVKLTLCNLCDLV